MWTQISNACGLTGDVCIVSWFTHSSSFFCLISLRLPASRIVCSRKLGRVRCKAVEQSAPDVGPRLFSETECLAECLCLREFTSAQTFRARHGCNRSSILPYSGPDLEGMEPTYSRSRLIRELQNHRLTDCSTALRYVGPCCFQSNVNPLNLPCETCPGLTRKWSPQYRIGNIFGRSCIFPCTMRGEN